MRSSALALALSLALVGGQVWAAPLCAAPGKDGPTYNPDTYYAGSGTASAGSQSVSLGAMRTGGGNASTTPVVAGDQVFIIQMQGADINNDNSAAYGNGSGQGYTAINNTGQYEFAVVASVSGSTLTLRDPLTNSYSSSGATSSSTRKSFQVIRVPQHSALTLTSNITTPAWDGFTGGVNVLDVAGALNFGGATIDASGAGFRGGGSYADPPQFGHTDYANIWNGVSGVSAGGMKGEGIAGTPSFVRRSSSDPIATNGIAANLASGDSGYPAGYVVARGAPGNAGGGGTQHNAGGGGGSNAGAGGQGGKTFGGDNSRDEGGLGGVAIAPQSSNLLAGGGGGAGDTNDFPLPDYQASITTGHVLSNYNLSSGGNGGGIIFVRADSLSGSGTLKANGGDGGDAEDNAGGGGGAGGTVAIVARQSSASLTITARGGTGGYSGHPQGSGYGTGGGGGGGAVLLSPGVTASADVAGGSNGLLFVPNANAGSYGAVAGSGGVGPASYSPAAANINLPSDCYPQISVVKTTSTPKLILPTAKQAAYTITLSNTAGRGDAVGVTISDPALPGSMTYASTTGIALAPGTATDGYRPTRYNETSPTAGDTAPAWSTFRIPGGGSVGITFIADLNSTPPSSTAYQNPAQATYLDPTRTTDTGTLTASYDKASSTGEDVLLVGKPNVVLEKWVRNVSQSGTFSTAANALPGEVLEYCINFRENNGSGYDAKNFVLTDASADVLGHADILPDAYGATGSGLGVRMASGVQLVAGDGQPVGSNLTTAADTDAAQLTQAGGLTYQIDLLGGTKGVVCFQVKIK